jgi:hypothetical protein
MDYAKRIYITVEFTKKREDFPWKVLAGEELPYKFHSE